MTESSPGIDPCSRVPKYHQLQEILLDLVEAELGVDAPIPSERELAERFSLSRMTVRQAIDGLVVVIRRFHVPTPGREADDDTTPEAAADVAAPALQS